MLDDSRFGRVVEELVLRWKEVLAEPEVVSKKNSSSPKVVQAATQQELALGCTKGGQQQEEVLGCTKVHLVVLGCTTERSEVLTAALDCTMVHSAGREEAVRRNRHRLVDQEARADLDCQTQEAHCVVGLPFRHQGDQVAACLPAVACHWEDRVVTCLPAVACRLRVGAFHEKACHHLAEAYHQEEPAHHVHRRRKLVDS